MALARASLGFLGMFFMAGAILLMLLTLLGGATNTNPLDIIYFLEAHTGNIPGAPEVSRWTFWNLCRVNGDGKSVCGTSHPDYPFDPAGRTNFDTTVNVPKAFVGTRHFFLTSRFVFPWLLIALFFAILSTTMMTAVFVQGRNHFHHNGQSAKLGAKAFAFMWTALFCICLSCVLYCVGGAVSRKRNDSETQPSEERAFFRHERSANGRHKRRGHEDGASGKETYN
ncbi:hypothetical protein MPDQ_002275 [Monascus purpureus]|uniref:Actin cortical patch SUR7/pH-response regulator PalI n=1 Tax=Monascus purpureus TaxID=5098 RepID=A0A507R275_MONPU|nr:hypothetical protein MPDQ_002275 [Monascus purpureus]